MSATLTHRELFGIVIIIGFRNVLKCWQCPEAVEPSAVGRLSTPGGAILMRLSSVFRIDKRVFKILKICVLLSIIASAFLWPEEAVSAQDKNPASKRVLATFVFQQGLPWSYRMEESMRPAFAAQTSLAIEFDVEHADRSRFPEETYHSKIVDLYRYKYTKQLPEAMEEQPPSGQAIPVFGRPDW